MSNSPILSPLNASIVNIRLNILFVNGILYIVSAYYSYLSIFSLINVYLISVQLGTVSFPGLLMTPHNMASQVQTLSTVRHPELIALYASALNHVLGLQLG